ncbi:unnamed protein product, partial [Ilex paraguariensis]
MMELQSANPLFLTITVYVGGCQWKNKSWRQLDEERIREIDKQGKGMEARRRWKMKLDVLSPLIARWFPLFMGIKESLLGELRLIVEVKPYSWASTSISRSGRDGQSDVSSFSRAYVYETGAPPAIQSRTYASLSTTGTGTKPPIEKTTTL